MTTTPEGPAGMPTNMSRAERYVEFIRWYEAMCAEGERIIAGIVGPVVPAAAEPETLPEIDVAVLAERIKTAVKALPAVKHRNLFPGQMSVGEDSVLAAIDEVLSRLSRATPTTPEGPAGMPETAFREAAFRDPEHFQSERFGWDFWARSCRGCGGHEPTPGMPAGWVHRGHREGCWLVPFLAAAEPETLPEIPGLDAAWARCEATSLTRVVDPAYPKFNYRAASGEIVDYGHTPAAALNALAARLSRATPTTGDET